MGTVFDLTIMALAFATLVLAALAIVATVRSNRPFYPDDEEPNARHRRYPKH